VQTVPCTTCGQRTRVCGDDCAWSAWSVCVGEPACVGPGETCTANGVCRGGIVEVPQATIQMGADPGVGDSDEHPEHPVTVPAFAIDRHEVACADFAAFLQARGNLSDEAVEYLDAEDPDAPIALEPGEGGGVWRPLDVCRRTPGGPATDSCADHPVFEVTWYGARDYCAWKGGRLPSEAEWERVASGAADWLFPWGEVGPGPTRANCSEAVCVDGYLEAAPVGSFPAGASTLGVEDLAGNVGEWIADEYHPTYVGAPTNGVAWVTTRPPAQPTFVVVRGGGWTSAVGDLRATARSAYAPTSTPSYPIGFRCAYDR
jgi:formylglycine-generating enzyme required for sulfatase activity